MAAGIVSPVRNCPSMMTGSALLVVAVLSVMMAAGGASALQSGFYASSCPQAEDTIYSTLQQLHANDPDLPPVLLRLHFHDCFVRGCDGSVLLQGSGTERTAPPNARLEGFAAIDAAKAAVDKLCPGVVSCADILAFAARDSVKMVGGPGWTVPAGRRDGTVSLASEASSNLPGAQMDVNQLTANFAKQGLTRDDMVILSGAHTIGEAACVHIDNRIYDYPSASGVDPLLPKDFAAKLKKKCSTRGLTDRKFDLDSGTSAVFDAQYYSNLAKRTGLLTSDQVLYEDARTRPLVMESSNKANFFPKFTQAMVKMSQISVLEGEQGQIRQRCGYVNA
ncbi:hypothetical protein KC19_6G170000 [Ceratodon purpureus]|uniref:Peroxidase n=1 Tax=Ceratodon purpureus TaxID=3225 RepID=A0A8T0HFJ4_CERPU|nr:hypothetical protein KC19_6G170000 [Ceratodon purpureus]